MAGLPGFNFEAFNECEAYCLSHFNETVLNPAKFFGGRTDLPWEFCIEECCKRIQEADCVYLLPGWENSRGVRRELASLNARRPRLYTYDPSMPEGNRLDALRFTEALWRCGYSAPLPAPETIEAEARRIISGVRDGMYGPPESNFQRIGLAWGSILEGEAIPAEKVALMMAALKLVREAYKPQRDNRVDAIGYVLCLDNIEGVR